MSQWLPKCPTYSVPSPFHNNILLPPDHQGQELLPRTQKTLLLFLPANLLPEVGRDQMAPVIYSDESSPPHRKPDSLDNPPPTGNQAL